MPPMDQAPTPKGGDRAHLDIRRAPGLPSIELHAGTAFTHSHPPHWHDEFFVTAITGGKGAFRFRGREHRAPAGTLVFIAPGEVHAHASGPGGRSFRSLHAGGTHVVSLAPELPTGLRSIAIADPRLLRKFLALHRLLEGEGSVLRKEVRLLAFLRDLGGLVPDTLPRPLPRSERAAVRRARELLDESC